MNAFQFKKLSFVVNKLSQDSISIIVRGRDREKVAEIKLSSLILDLLDDVSITKIAKTLVYLQIISAAKLYYV